MASVDQFEDHCWKDVIPEADMNLGFYKGCRRETFVGPNVALLAIDLYNSVYRGGAKFPTELYDTAPNSCGIFAHRAVEPTKKLFSAARAAGIPIIYCTQDQRPQNRPTGAVSTRNKKTRPANAEDHGIFPDFTPHVEDIVIYKQRASVFQGTPIVSHLTLLGVQSLIICGESTSGCVRASAVDAYSAGYHISIAEECTFDRAELTHKVNLFDMHHKYVDVMHVDEIAAHLRQLASRAQAAE